MSWTVQARCGCDVQGCGVWDDWSGNQAYDSVDRAVQVMMLANDVLHGRIYQIRAFDKDTGEVIPFEALGI